MEIKKMFNRDIVVSASDNNGIIVKIGYGIFCYTVITFFLDDLREYLEDSEGWENKYNSSHANMTEPACEEAEPAPPPQPTLGSGENG